MPGPHEDRKDYYNERDGVFFAGHHLIIDLVGARKLDDLEHIEQTLERCVEVAGATLLRLHLDRDASTKGVSGFAALAGSHIGFHSSPATGFAAIDVFIRGHRRGDERPYQIVELLREAFSAREAIIKTHKRGPDASALAVRPASAASPTAEVNVGVRQRTPRPARKAKAA